MDVIGGRNAFGRVDWRWRLAWASLLALIAFDVAQVALGVAAYTSLLRWPGAMLYAAEPLVGLAGYALVISALPFARARLPGFANALRVGALAGLIGGALEVLDIAAESLLALPQAVVSLASSAAMLALFLLFTLAGFAGARRARMWGPGVAAAIWCAMVAILIAVTFGFLLMHVALPQLAREMVSDPDYLRSGWTDTAAFAIANTFDNGFTHMVEAPIIAAILGALGAAAAMLTTRRGIDARA